MRARYVVTWMDGLELRAFGYAYLEGAIVLFNELAEKNHNGARITRIVLRDFGEGKPLTVAVCPSTFPGQPVSEVLRNLTM